MSESTDKLALLTDCVNRIPDDIRRRVKSFSLKWESIDVGDFEYVACPNIEVELYPITGGPFTVPFNTDKPQ